MTETVTDHVRQQWEYTTLIRRTNASLLMDLNVSGQEGWELITVLHYKDMKGEASWIGFLKRPGTGQPSASAAQAETTVQTEVQASDETQVDTHGFDLSDGDFDFKE